MGFKSNKNQSNKCKQIKVNGLLFDSEEDYQILRHLDSIINQIVDLVNNKEIDLKDVFKNIKTFNVEEAYVDAREELDSLFKNATNLLCYEGTRYINDYKVACRFFDKINVIECLDVDF